MPRLNPFPASDGPIGEDLFVGRNDIVQKFEAFLSRDARERYNEVWVVAGERGQGKSSLFGKLANLPAVARPSSAIGRHTWRENSNEMFPLARELYGSILASRKGGRRAVPVFWGGLRYYAGKLIPFASYQIPATGGAQVSLSHLAPKPRNGAELVNLLALHLREEVRSVVLMIDEVSKTPPISVDKTKRLANSVADTRISNAVRALNILTVAFVQPKDVEHFEAAKGGPRSMETFVLRDFSQVEVEGLVQRGLELSRALAEQGSLTPASADIRRVASRVIEWVGGVPTLTVGLLHDAFEQMKKRVESGAAPVLEGKDVDDSVTNGKTPEVERRIGSFVKNFSVPSQVGLRENVFRLLGAFASEDYGHGQWNDRNALKTKMQKTVGATRLATEAIDVCFQGLIDAHLLVRDGAHLRFRGRLLMNRLVELLQ